jgi:hypothetical protein
MQLGKTLVGAIIGAALGIGLLIAVFLFAGIDKMWMAIPVALLTGLGVRMVASTSGHASYLRGAITVLLALGAYLGGLAITKAVANHRAEVASKVGPRHVAAEEPGAPGDAKDGEPAVEAPPIAPPTPAPNPELGTHRPAMPRQSFSTWDFISLAVAALVAYELGRGTGVPKENLGAGPSEPTPGGMHPDA